MSIFDKHPLPWSVNPEHPSGGWGEANPLVLDAVGEPVLRVSEWLICDDGVLETMVAAVNERCGGR